MPVSKTLKLKKRVLHYSPCYIAPFALSAFSTAAIWTLKSRHSSSYSAVRFCAFSAPIWTEVLPKVKACMSSRSQRLSFRRLSSALSSSMVMSSMFFPIAPTPCLYVWSGSGGCRKQLRDARYGFKLEVRNSQQCLLHDCLQIVKRLFPAPEGSFRLLLLDLFQDLAEPWPRREPQFYQVVARDERPGLGLEALRVIVIEHLRHGPFRVREFFLRHNLVRRARVRLRQDQAFGQGVTQVTAIAVHGVFARSASGGKVEETHVILDGLRDQGLGIPRQPEPPAEEDRLVRAEVVVAVKADVAVRFAKSVGLCHVVQQTGETKRRDSRHPVFDLPGEVVDDCSGVGRGKGRQIVQHAVHVARGLDGMGEDVVGPVHAGRESAQGLELRQKRRKEAEGVEEQEVACGVPLGQDQEELIPHPFGRGFRDRHRSLPDVACGLRLDRVAERRGETDGTKESQRVLVQGRGSHDPDHAVPDVPPPVERIDQAFDGPSGDELPEVERHGVDGEVPPAEVGRE